MQSLAGLALNKGFGLKFLCQCLRYIFNIVILPELYIAAKKRQPFGCRLDSNLKANASLNPRAHVVLYLL